MCDLARARAVVARGAHDHQHARARAGVLLLLLGGHQPVAGLAPLHRELVVRIVEARARLGRLRRLAVLLVAVPGDGLEPGDRLGFLAESRVVEVGAETACEFLARHGKVWRLALAGFGHRGLRWLAIRS